MARFEFEHALNPLYTGARVLESRLESAILLKMDAANVGIMVVLEVADDVVSILDAAKVPAKGEQIANPGIFGE